MFHLLLPLLVSCCVDSIPLESIDLGHCGKMSTTFESFDRQSDDDEEANGDVRIVGGFDAPEPVPWFVMLKINTQNGSFAGYQCGATLITTKFILTAAHCVCNKNVHYCMKADDEGRISDEDFHQEIDMIALLGLIYAYNLEELSDGQTKDRHLRHIQKVLIHHHFNPSSISDREIPSGPDIALLKMDRAVPYDLKSAPACLPGGNLFPDRPSDQGIFPRIFSKQRVRARVLAKMILAADNAMAGKFKNLPYLEKTRGKILQIFVRERQLLLAWVVFGINFKLVSHQMVVPILTKHASFHSLQMVQSTQHVFAAP